MESGREGTHYPLFERLGQDPAMQQLVLDLSQRALALAEEVDINALWEGTRANAASLDPEHADQASLRALQAMATFMNAQSWIARRSSRSTRRPASRRPCPTASHQSCGRQ